jgi:hypothetical protein
VEKIFLEALYFGSGAEVFVPVDSEGEVGSEGVVIVCLCWESDLEREGEPVYSRIQTF